jgi:hypothetical protein
MGPSAASINTHQKLEARTGGLYESSDEECEDHYGHIGASFGLEDGCCGFDGNESVMTGAKPRLNKKKPMTMQQVRANAMASLISRRRGWLNKLSA